MMRTRSENKGYLRRMYTHTHKHKKKHLNNNSRREAKKSRKLLNPAEERATQRWKENQALSSGWFSEPQIGSCPDGVASDQKGHFVEFLPEWLYRWLVNKRYFFQ